MKTDVTLPGLPFHPAHSHTTPPCRGSHGLPSRLIYHPFCTIYHSPGSGTRRPITKDTTGDETIRTPPCARDRVDHSLRIPNWTPTPSLGRFYGNDLYIRRGRGGWMWQWIRRKGRLSTLDEGQAVRRRAPATEVGFLLERGRRMFLEAPLPPTMHA